MRKDDFLNKAKEKKDKFKDCLNFLNCFLRDWSGIEHDYASKLSSLADKSGLLPRLEKLSQESMKDCANIIRTYISSCSLIHSRLSKTLEVYSTQELLKFRVGVKEVFKQVEESGKIAEQNYRRELTEYASKLVDSSNINLCNEELDFSKVNIRDFQEKHRMVLDEIISALNYKIENVEEAVRDKIFEILEQFDKNPQIIDEKVIQNIFNDQSTGEKVLNNWVAPRFKLIFDRIDKNLSTNSGISELFVPQIKGAIEDLISELKCKCENSSELWIPQVCQFIITVTEKILSKTLVNVEKVHLPTLQEFLSKDEDYCLNLYTRYFSATDKPDKVWMSRIVTRTELLYNFGTVLKSIFSQLQDCEYFLDKCQAKVKQAKKLMVKNLAYKIIKGEFFQIFLTLYEPHPLTYFMNSVKEFFQMLNGMSSTLVYSKVLKSSFFWFIEYWKISIIKLEPSKSAEERIEELKKDTKALSIFFEDKQNDSSILGVPREVQKEFLQNHFDCISLSINSNKELVQLFLTDGLEFDKATIALILICRNDQDAIRTLIKHKNRVVD